MARLVAALTGLATIVGAVTAVAQAIQYLQSNQANYLLIAIICCCCVGAVVAISVHRASLGLVAGASHDWVTKVALTSIVVSAFALVSIPLVVIVVFLKSTFVTTPAASTPSVPTASGGSTAAPTPPDSTPPSSGEPIPRTTAPAASVVITTPANLATISMAEGVTIAGSATNFAGRHLWISDVTAGDSTWVLDSEVAVRDDRWTFHNAPIGDDDKPLPQHVIMNVVEGGQDCADSIAALPRDKEGDVSFEGGPPQACKTVGTREIVVARR